MATVRLGGAPLPGQTPITDLRLPQGTHEVELLSSETGSVHRYEVKIEAGKTTSLVVDLR